MKCKGSIFIVAEIFLFYKMVQGSVRFEMKIYNHKIFNNIFYLFLFLLFCSTTGKKSSFQNYAETLCFPKIEVSENKEPSTSLKANRDQSELFSVRNLIAGLPSAYEGHLDLLQEDNAAYFPNPSNKLQVLFDKFSYFSLFFCSNISSRGPPLFIS